jgi:hypothetical protein
VERARRKDIRDYSAIDNATIFSDARIKAHRPDYKTFPFTVVRTWKIKKKSTYFLPNWTPFNGEDIPVMKASLKVSYPKGFDLRFKELNMPDVRTETTADDRNIIQWAFKDYDPHDLEPFAPLFSDRRPLVYLAPANFDLDGVNGQMDSWASFGKFITQLNKDRQELPEKTLEEIKQLVAGVDSITEKIQKLYEYMQDRTRYVSIQIGIGGWQPFDAETVDQLGYGDCKALSNYMKALLMAEGIESHYTLVRAGTHSSRIISDFPNNDFNHAILCVPLEKDTVWLECTSQHNPWGFLGDFTDGRDVLVIDNGVGKIARTPTSSEKNNTRKTTGFIDLDDHGNALAKSETLFKGTYYDQNMTIINYLDEKDRTKKLTKSLHFPGFNLNNYSFAESKTRDPSITRKLEFSVEDLASPVGTRRMLPLNILHKHIYVPRNIKNRKWPVFIQRGWQESDKWEIKIPEGFNIDAIPGKVEISTPYGNYTAIVSYEENTITYSREFIVYRGKYPAEDYSEFRDFLSTVVKADQQKCLLSTK